VRPSVALPTRPSRSGAARLAAVALVGGLVASSLAIAAPVGAAGTMKADLYKLRMCESGDNYRAASGNGYFGAYQFAPATWHALGFHGRPDHARAVTQNRAARDLHSREGWRAWPSCARVEHLR
jgi:Transglycosylase-like domain